jgi:flagellar P-ring protein precursor FlgI
MGGAIAEATDPSTVVLSMPKDFKGSMSKMISEIELLQIIPDQIARVVIDERSGVIVMGSNVRVSTVAIAQGNLTIAVNEQPQVSQPNPLANGETVVVPQTTVQVDEQGNRKLAILKEGIALSELVDGLNALGIGPRDMISILQAIKAAGALQAEIEVM